MLTKEIVEQLLKSAKSADENLEVFGASEHKYQLNPVTTLEKVQQFEEKYGLKLPETYVKFLTEIGNGGAGPYYGLYSLEQLEICNSENLHQDTAKQAFIDKTMTADMWKEAMDKMDDESIDDEESDALLRDVTTGILIIGTQGCTFDTLLMCSGSETGKIVYIDWNLERENVPYLTGMTFEDWYLKFFEEVAAKHNIYSYGRRYIESEEDLIRHYNSANTFEEKYKCIVSFLRFKKLSPNTIDFFMHLQEKEMDSVRLYVLLQTKSKEGISLFQTFLEGENKKAAVSSARLLPKEVKDKFYSSMLKLLYEEKDVDQTCLFYLSDCSSVQAADIVRYARDKTNSEDLRRTAIYVMGQCSDAEKYINDFIAFMKEDYWIAHSALQAAISAELKSKELDACYKWMAEKYAKDTMMQKKLAHVLK